MLGLSELLEGEEMGSFFQLLAFGAGSACIGVTLTLGGIFALSRRVNGEDSAEGCVFALLFMIMLGMAGAFFMMAVTG